jgi:hypothetical protein
LSRVLFRTIRWNKFRIAASCGWDWQKKWGQAVLGQQYLVRQATNLLKFAKSVRDPNVSAALVEEGADLTDRLDETMPPVDPNQAPDLEPAAQPGAWRRHMTPQVLIRRHTASEICDVVVFVRGQEIILRCPNYSQALKWARLECKSYKISEPEIEPLDGLGHDEELPLLVRSPETAEA